MNAWDDIRYFLALVRFGTVRKAATALKVNHTTVSRRFREFERRLGSQLLQRTPDGYVLTPDGEVMFASGKSIEREVQLSEQRVQGSNDSVAGKVSITLTDLLLQKTSPALGDLLQKHSGLELEISVSPRIKDLTRREADIGLRLSFQPPDGLLGTKLGHMPIAIYASKRLVPDPLSVNLGALPWVRWQDPWRPARLEAWFKEHYPNANIVAHVDSYSSLELLVVEGAGLGLLSPWTAENREDLVQVSDPIDVFGMDVWLLLHPDLRNLRRIQVVNDALIAALRTSV